MIDCLYDCFKHWAARGDIKIISDPHFQDEDTKLINSNWPDAETYLEKINKKVMKNETLIILGDCGDPEYIKRLNGYKVLICGNHDKPRLYKDIVDEIYKGPLFIAPQILLSHEPVKAQSYCINIHGHSHSGLLVHIDDFGGIGINLAANVVNWEVLSLGELIRCGILSGVPDIHRQTIDLANLKREEEGKVDEGL